MRAEVRTTVPLWFACRYVVAWGNRHILYKVSPPLHGPQGSSCVYIGKVSGYALASLLPCYNCSMMFCDCQVFSIFVLWCSVDASCFSLRLWIEAQKPYEFIGLLNMMLRNPMILYVFWAWCLECLWIYKVFRLQTNGPNTLRLKQLNSIQLGYPFNLFCLKMGSKQCVVSCCVQSERQRGVALFSLIRSWGYIEQHITVLATAPSG